MKSNVDRSALMWQFAIAILHVESTLWSTQRETALYIIILTLDRHCPCQDVDSYAGPGENDI